ncbi:epoxide hydrolase N-terminal domain-containing protein [Streptomyces sp. NPDC056670]|uniref:epoxide hydrolase N-terminal domain-containing protein n=1 Tax=Streptomyces sp. NPDC056670 TaxID=3345904 RepID=UPI0036CA85E7
MPTSALSGSRPRRYPVPGAKSEWDRGIPSACLHEPAGYWANGFDWRAHEARLPDTARVTSGADRSACLWPGSYQTVRPPPQGASR